MKVKLFGKMPAHGDFVSRGLTADEVAHYDRWLSGSVAAAQAALGEGFAERFDAAPPWRFAAAGWAGALTASQDAVGRRFPLLLAVAADAADACEALLYDAIVGGWTADDLFARAAALDPAADVTGQQGWWLADSDAARAEAEPADLLLAMLTVTERA